MNQDYSTGNRIVDEVGRINISGNIIPMVWFQAIRYPNGKPNVNAIIILADIVYWYRPTEIRDEITGQVVGRRKKFRDDLLQRSYGQISELFGLTKKQVVTAVNALEQMGVIKRNFRNMRINGQFVSNVLYLELIPQRLHEITYPGDGMELPVSTYKETGIPLKKGRHPPAGEKYYLTNENGERLGEGTYISKQKTPLSEKDERLLSVLEIVPIVAAPIYSALCIIAASLLFYRNKLKEPLIKLRVASENIANNDLDFRVDYHSKDELGQLCVSFEIMRSTLESNFSEMWRQMEERKQLNAAFAHDLRTPLTVLKGYDEILQTSADAMTRETAQTMEKQILRLERYVDSMSSLRRLEDAQPQYEELQLQEFLSALTESAALLCAQSNKKLAVHNQTMVTYTILDRSFVTQVCHNLLSNALRACGTGGKVQLTLRRCESFWKLTVLDDGCGLPETSREAWLENRRCFLGGAGLGLLLCRECCRRMGWDLQVEQRAPEKGTRAVVTIPLCDEPMPEPTVELRSDCSPVRTQQQYQLRNMLVRELRTMPERGGTEDP